MKTVKIDVNLKHTFGNLLRKKHVLVVIQNKAGEVILGAKPFFYPEGICRLIGGGIEKDEEVADAAVREIEEEIGVHVKKSEIKHLFEIIVNAKVGKETHRFVTNICHVQHAIELDEINAGDDIQGVKALSLTNLLDLIEKYKNFSDDFCYEDGKGYGHLWQDYGKVYAPIHQIVHDYLSYGRKNL